MDLSVVKDAKTPTDAVKNKEAMSVNTNVVMQFQDRKSNDAAVSTWEEHEFWISTLQNEADEDGLIILATIEIYTSHLLSKFHCHKGSLVVWYPSLRLSLSYLSLL